MLLTYQSTCLGTLVKISYAIWNGHPADFPHPVFCICLWIQLIKPKSKSKWREKSYEWCDDWSPQNSSGSDTYITVCFTLCPTELNLILYICSNTCITCCCCFSRLRHWGHENHRCIIRCLRPPLLNGHRFREPSHRSIFYLFEWRPGVFPSSEN